MLKEKKVMGKKIDPGRARLGKKMDQLVVYTSLPQRGINQFGVTCPSSFVYSFIVIFPVWAGINCSLSCLLTYNINNSVVVFAFL